MTTPVPNDAKHGPLNNGMHPSLEAMTSAKAPPYGIPTKTDGPYNFGPPYTLPEVAPHST